MKVLDINGLNYYDGKIKQTYAPLASPSFTGTPTAPTPTAGDNSTKIATTAFVNDYLPLAGGTMTGKLGIKKQGTDEFDLNMYNDGSLVYFGWGTDQNYNPLGSNILLHSNTSSNGTMELLVNDGNNNTSGLTLSPNGNLKWNNNNVITSAGGTMTGTLNLQANPSTNDSLTDLVRFDGVTGQGLTYRKEAAHKHCLYLSMNEGGGWPSEGGQIELWGGTDTDGHITITASNGTNYKPLMLRPDGTLTWDGKNVAVVNSSSLNSSGGYIRFTNGLQICWGANSGNSIPQTITYPVAFNGLPCIGIQSGDYMATSWATTGFSLGMAAGHTKPSTVYFRYIAVGAWG